VCGRFGCDVLGNAMASAELVELVWPRVLDQLAVRADAVVEMAVRDDDTALAGAARAAGFQPTSEVAVTTWISASDRPPVAPVPGGFQMLGRDQVRAGLIT